MRAHPFLPANAQTQISRTRSASGGACGSAQFTLATPPTRLRDGVIVEKGLQRQEGLSAYPHTLLNVKGSTKSSRGLDVDQFDLLYQNRRTKYSIVWAPNEGADYCRETQAAED